MFDKCRTCLESQGTLIDLGTPQRLDLISKWTALTNFEWIEHEELGLFMCEACMESLDFSFKFQQQCMESNQVYEELVRDFLNQSFEVEQKKEVNRGNEEVDEQDEEGNEETKISHKSFVKPESKEAQIGRDRVKEENEISIQGDLDDEEEHVIEIVLVDETDIKLEKEVFTCEHCQKEYMNKQALQIHIRHVHKTKERFKCNFCMKTFNRKCHKQEHERVHVLKKPFICDVCGKRYSHYSSWHTHKRSHEELKLVCKICQKSYVRSSELKVHMRKHTGNKPFLCVVCGHAFAQSSHLKEHLATHSEERPHECESCGKGFKTRSLLNTHRRTHTGIKKFKCTTCEYSCHQPYRLSQHIKTHGKANAAATATAKNSRKQHVCQICQKSYSGSAPLKLHMSTIHNVVTSN